MSSIASPAYAVIAVISLVVILHARADAALEEDVGWGSDGHCGVRLWIPPGLAAARGVVVLNTGIDGDDRGAVDDARWRAAAELWGFAIVGTYLHGGNYGNAGQGSGQALLGCLERLAGDSGHPELRDAPIAMYGFSHGAAFTYSFTWFAPTRMIAFVCAKSGFPTDADVPAALMVPGALIYGQYDDGHVYPALSGLFARHRAQGARWTLAEDWGMAHEYGNTEALAMPFFDRAIALRLPWGASSASGRVALVDPPASDGWLVDVEHLDVPLATVAPTALYPGAADRAGWVIDGCAAVAWRASSSAGSGAVLASPGAYGRYDGDPAHVDLALDDSACSAAVVAVEWYDGATVIGTTRTKARGAWRATLANPVRGLHAITAVAIGSAGERIATRVAPIFVMSVQTGATAFASVSDGPGATPAPSGPDVVSAQPVAGAVTSGTSGGGGCGIGSMTAAGIITVLAGCFASIRRPRRFGRGPVRR